MASQDMEGEVFQSLTIWEFIMTKVHFQQPDNPAKKMLRLFEEMERVLEMFQIEVNANCVISKIDSSTMSNNSCETIGGENITPDKNCCKFLGIPPASKIYLTGQIEDSGPGVVSSQSSKMDIDVVSKKEAVAKSANLQSQSADIPSESMEEEDEIENYVKVKVEEGSDELMTEGESPVGEKHPAACHMCDTKFDNSGHHQSHMKVFHNVEMDSGSDLQDKKGVVDDLTTPPIAISDMKMEHQSEKFPEDLQKYCVPDNRTYKPEYPIEEELFNRMTRGKIPKQCPKCGHYFKFMHLLLKHMKIQRGCIGRVKAPKNLEFETEDPETGKKVYGCAFQGCHERTKTIWKNKIGVHLHYSSAHQECVKLEAKCSLCEKKFLTSAILNVHMKKAHVKKAHMEPHVDPKLEIFCKPLTNRTADWNDGMIGYNSEFPISNEDFNKIIQGKIPKQCPKCGIYYTKIYNLLKHWRETPDCEAPAEQEQEVNEDVLWPEDNQVPDDLQKYCVPDNRNYKPDFPMPEEIYNKMKEGKIPKQCIKCGHFFRYMHLMIKHLKNQKGCKGVIKAPKNLEFQTEDPETGEKRFGCTFEGCHQMSPRLWKRIYGVHLHYSQAHKEFVSLEAECSQCKQKFLTTALVKMHLRKCKSAENQNLTCSVCGKSYKNAEALKTHEATHQSFKSFACNFCDFTTNTRSNINQHKRYNHADQLGIEVEVHQCEHCGKEFRNKSGLKQHVESAHSDAPDPKFKCHICAKQLKQSNSYRKHMVNAHQQGEKCEICGKLYLDREVLDRHIKKVHED